MGLKWAGVGVGDKGKGYRILFGEKKEEEKNGCLPVASNLFLHVSTIVLFVYWHFSCVTFENLNGWQLMKINI